MPNENRELATIQKISKLEPIEKADRLEKATVLGWDVVVKKGDFHEGQKVVYFEIDSFLPIDERFDFLRDSSYKKTQLMGEGYRLKTIKLRGQVSQGLVLPVEDFPEINNPQVGDDVTDALGVKLYQVEEKIANDGTKTISRFHEKISKTDEIRVQSQPGRHNALKGKPYYIAEKIDGSSTTISFEKDKGVRIFTRNIEIIEDTNHLLEDSKKSLWSFFREIGLVDALERCEDDVYFQGEIYGPGIQSNRLKKDKMSWSWFNVGYIREYREERVPQSKWKDFFEQHPSLKEFENQHVKILEEGESFDYELDALQDLTVGNYDGAGQREGIVIRPKENILYKEEPLSMKVINNKYLLKNDE